MRDDLAEATRRARGAEHADLDLDARDELLDEHLLVVPEGELHAGAKLVFIVDFVMPTDGRGGAGFTKTGKPYGFSGGAPFLRVMFRVTGTP